MTDMTIDEIIFTELTRVDALTYDDICQRRYGADYDRTAYSIVQRRCTELVDEGRLEKVDGNGRVNLRKVITFDDVYQSWFQPLWELWSPECGDVPMVWSKRSVYRDPETLEYGKPPKIQCAFSWDWGKENNRKIRQAIPDSMRPLALQAEAKDLIQRGWNVEALVPYVFGEVQDEKSQWYIELDRWVEQARSNPVEAFGLWCGTSPIKPAWRGSWSPPDQIQFIYERGALGTVRNLGMDAAMAMFKDAKINQRPIRWILNQEYGIGWEKLLELSHDECERMLQGV